MKRLWLVSCDTYPPDPLCRFRLYRFRHPLELKRQMGIHKRRNAIHVDELTTGLRALRACVVNECNGC